MAEENNITTPAFNELILEEDINSAKVSGLQTRPNAPTSYGGNGLSAAELQEHFDKLAMLAIHKINAIIAAIKSDTYDFSKNLPINSLTFKTLDSLVGGIVSGALANAIKVDSNDNGETDNEYDATLQAVLTTLLTKAKSLETDIGNGTLADNLAVDPYGGKSTLQTVLTALTGYVTKLKGDISDGQLASDIYVGETKIDGKTVYYLSSYLSQLKEYVNTLEAGLKDGDILNRIIAKKHGTIDEKNLSEVLTELETDIAQVESNANKAYRYMGSTRFEDLNNNAGNRREGDVWNISNSFVLVNKAHPAGTKYPAGTNVAWNATAGEWDPLGGFIDYGSLASEIAVTPYSGKTKLQEVLDILSTPWDLIITDPADLGELSTASGNVLVRLEGEYTESLKITLSEGLKLLDFGYSTIKEVRLTATISANTIVRNLNTIPPEDITTGEENGYLDNFGAVENCRGILRYANCSSIENSDIKEAVSCSYIRDCTVVYSEASATAIFENCNFINNVDVSGYAAVNGYELHFSNCHHISNIHDYYEQSSSNYISYSECNFVDPYTCAGYVQTEDIGKVPVPTEKGGVEFKDFVPLLPNASDTLKIYVQNTEKDGGSVGIRTASPADASQGVFPIRAANGQIKAPNQITHTPGLDEFISRRYFEANLPSGGGGKLYRHSIRIMSYEGGFWCCEVYFTLYTTYSTAYNDVDELPLQKGEHIPAGGNYDPHDMSESVYPVTSFIYNNLTPMLEYFYSPNEYDQKTKCGRDIFTLERGANVYTTFTDTVTEV